MEQDLLHDWDDTPADEKKGDQLICNVVQVCVY